MKPERTWIGRFVSVAAACSLVVSGTAGPIAADSLSSTNSMFVGEDSLVTTEVTLLQQEEIPVVPENESTALQDTTFDATECVSLLYSLLLARQLNPEFQAIDTIEDFLHLLEGTCSLSEGDPELYYNLKYSALVANTEETLLSDLNFFSDSRGIGRIAVPLPDSGRIVSVPVVPQLTRQPKLVALCFFTPDSKLQERFCDVYNRSPFPNVQKRNIALTDFTAARINTAVRSALDAMSLAEGDVIVVSAHGYLLPATGDTPYPAGFQEGDTVTIYGDIVTEADVRQAMAGGRALHSTRILDAIKSTLDQRRIHAHAIVDSCYSGRLVRNVQNNSFALGRIRVLMSTSSEYSCATPAGFTNALHLALRAHQRQAGHDSRVTFNEFLDLYLGYPGSHRPLEADDVFSATGSGLTGTLMQLQSP